MTSESPIGDMVAVTPHDTTAILETNGERQATRAIYVGVIGDVTVVTPKGQTETMVNLASGVWHPVRVTRILATGTDATNILAGF